MRALTMLMLLQLLAPGVHHLEVAVEIRGPRQPQPDDEDLVEDVIEVARELGRPGVLRDHLEPGRDPRIRVVTGRPGQVQRSCGAGPRFKRQRVEGEPPVGGAHAPEQQVQGR